MMAATLNQHRSLTMAGCLGLFCFLAGLASADPGQHQAAVIAHQAKLDPLRVVYTIDKTTALPGREIALPDGETLKGGSESWDYRVLRSKDGTRVDWVATGGPPKTPVGTRYISSYLPDRFESWAGGSGVIKKPLQVNQDWHIGRSLAMALPSPNSWMTGSEWEACDVVSQEGDMVTLESTEILPSGVEKRSQWTFDMKKDYCLTAS